jgi:hypothetical protein
MRRRRDVVAVARKSVRTTPMVKLKRITGTAGRHLATFSSDFRLTTRALHWDRGRPGVPGRAAPLGWLTRPPRAARLNINSSDLDHVERVVRAERSFAGEGARGPSEELE